MATEDKKPATAKAGGGKPATAKTGADDRRRLVYLKERAKELKVEMLANREELGALREKLIGGKKNAAGAAKGGD